MMHYYGVQSTPVKDTIQHGKGTHTSIHKPVEILVVISWISVSVPWYWQQFAMILLCSSTPLAGENEAIR